MTARTVAMMVCEQVEDMAGELERYQELYWELRGVMDGIRAKVNAPEGMADGEVSALVALVPRVMVAS